LAKNCVKFQLDEASLTARAGEGLSSVEKGLSLLAEAQAAVEQTGARFWEAEV
jgi:hypothetical protein